MSKLAFHTRRWLAPAILVGTALGIAMFRSRRIGGYLDNLRRYSAPSAALYDALASRPLAGFYAKVAREVTALTPQGHVLEIGPGPGRLAVKLAHLAPEIRVTGVDISPEMVARANALAAKSGLASRVSFKVGDVAALDFPDASFDAVVSTLSFHHWENPAKGLAEIYRVLRPDGVTFIYDIADWIRALHLPGPGASQLAPNSPFLRGGVRTIGVTTRIGPLPIISMVELRRPPVAESTSNPS